MALYKGKSDGTYQQIAGFANVQAILNMIGSLSDLTTTVKTNIVAAINSLVTKFADYLPLAGGTMTGAITFNSGSTEKIKTNSDNGTLLIIGGTSDATNATLQLNGNSTTGEEGEFTLTANDGNDYATLNGKPSGTLWWNNKQLATTEHLNNYLPKSGGTMTGAIGFNGTSNKLTNSGNNLTFGGNEIVCGPTDITNEFTWDTTKFLSGSINVSKIGKLAVVNIDNCRFAAGTNTIASTTTAKATTAITQQQGVLHNYNTKRSSSLIQMNNTGNIIVFDAIAENNYYGQFVYWLA